MSEARQLQPEPTPVEEIRRVRERLHRQFGGDVCRQAAYARKITEELRERLGLKPAADAGKDSPVSGASSPDTSVVGKGP
jgi:hypothetical protein